MAQTSNLGSTVISGASAGLMATLVVPIVKAKCGVDLTAEQAGAVVGLLAGVLHCLVMLPAQVIAWRAAWNAPIHVPPAMPPAIPSQENTNA